MAASLFLPYQMQNYKLKNRIVMAPLTRQRTSPDRVPNAMMLEYYMQRAGAGMILSEATVISPSAVGYEFTPGIYTAEQIQGWQPITKALSAAGTPFFCQLWHVGRISDPTLLQGALPVAPSALAAKGHVSRLRPLRDFVTPRALTTDEVYTILNDYEQSAKHALEAGFAGVEIHGANGYLPDQFLQSFSNMRKDEFGGSKENRARFLLEAVDRVARVWGYDRVGVHLSPRGDSHDMGDANPKETFGYLAEELEKRHVAFVFLREYPSETSLAPLIRQRFHGTLILNESLDRSTAIEVVESQQADLVAFGKDFISNPDLPFRLEKNLGLAPYKKETFYEGGADGYINYPPLTENK